MTGDRSPSGDLLGIAPFGDAVRVLAQGTVDAAGAFLSRICLPAAEEFGYLLRDKVHAFRTKNILTVVAAAEAKLLEGATRDLHAPPRLVGAILEEASWVEDPNVQDMWAGLLASSCSSDGTDDANVLFVDLLRRLTRVQVRILDFACRTAEKKRTPLGLVVAGQLSLELTPLQALTRETDVQRLDRELDHLSSLELLDHGGFPVSHDATLALITPTSLALHMYVRCQGSSRSPVDFFSVTNLIDMEE
jgi:hypothetical protein